MLFLAKFLSNQDGDNFFKNCFNNFQNEELLKKHKNCCENSDYINRVQLQKFKINVDKKTGKEIEVPGNTFKHTFRCRSLYPCLIVFYDFKTMDVKLYDA